MGVFDNKKPKGPPPSNLIERYIMPTFIRNRPHGQPPTRRMYLEDGELSAVLRSNGITRSSSSCWSCFQLWDIVWVWLIGMTIAIGVSSVLAGRDYKLPLILNWISIK